MLMTICAGSIVLQPCSCSPPWSAVIFFRILYLAPIYCIRPVCVDRAPFVQCPGGGSVGSGGSGCKATECFRSLLPVHGSDEGLCDSFRLQDPDHHYPSCVDIAHHHAELPRYLAGSEVGGSPLEIMSC